jgi:hypothetical protein
VIASLTSCGMTARGPLLSWRIGEPGGKDKIVNRVPDKALVKIPGGTLTTESPAAGPALESLIAASQVVALAAGADRCRRSAGPKHAATRTSQPR